MQEPVYELAKGLVARCPWLIADPHAEISSETDRGRRFGRLCATLRTLGLTDTGWTTSDVLQLIDTRNMRLGLYSVPAGNLRDPLALFAHQVRVALAESGDPTPPVQRRRNQFALMAAETARAQAARRAHDTQLEAERHDPQIQKRHAERLAHLRAHLAAITPPTRLETPLPPSAPRALRTQLR